jgi:hypothetical protein
MEEKAVLGLPKTLSTPQTSGKLRNPHQTKHIKLSQNLHLSFIQLGTIKSVDKEGPAPRLGLPFLISRPPKAAPET